MTPREAVCQFMGWDTSEAETYRYHYGRTTVPVYSTHFGFILSLPNGKKIPADIEEYFDGETKWVKGTGGTCDYLSANGKTIWVFVGEQP